MTEMQFNNKAERDAFIDENYPQRECTDTPGLFKVPGGSLGVHMNQVTFYPAALKVPVIYLLDENGEAYDVLWFCNSTCRNLYETTETSFVDVRFSEGEDSAWVEETFCDYCGGQLEEFVGKKDKTK